MKQKKTDASRASEELGAAIEATAPEDWKETGRERGYVFSEASSQGWSIHVGYGEGQDGAATKGGMVMHFTPEQALAARKKAEGA